MGDLISREALLEEIKKDLKEKDTSGNTAPFITGLIYRQFDIEKIIEEQPQVEAVPVVHGEWRHIGGDEWCCSECGNVISTEGSWEKPTGKFCEECGADMRKRCDR